MAAHIHHAIDYIEFAVTDVARAKKFYAAAFGWKFNDYGSEYAGIRRGKKDVGGIRWHPVDPAGGGPLLILYSRNLDATLAAVREAGGRVTLGPFTFPGGRRFHFIDPNGYELAVWSDR